MVMLVFPYAVSLMTDKAHAYAMDVKTHNSSLTVEVECHDDRLSAMSLKGCLLQLWDRSTP